MHGTIIDVHDCGCLLALVGQELVRVPAAVHQIDLDGADPVGLEIEVTMGRRGVATAVRVIEDSGLPCDPQPAAVRS